MWLAALAYADDVVLLASTVRAIRTPLKICDGFASVYDVVFNAMKSKCLLTKPTRGRYTVGSIPSIPFCIGGEAIEFVDSWPHLCIGICIEC